MGRLRLHHRIVVPLWLVAGAMAAVGAYVTLSVISRTLEWRVEARMLDASAVISRSDFALNPAILASVKAITGADVITFTTQGTILATTVRQGHTGFRDAVIASDAARRALSSGARVFINRQMSCDGGPCYVVYRPLANRPGAVVAFAADMSEIESVTGEITRLIVASTAASFLAIVLVSQIMARRVTMPIERLVAFTRDAGPGPDARAPVGHDEVGRLGLAFNDMLDRLERSQASLVRSEKLGLAGLMAARVAHDIRNPLASIKMQTQLLRPRMRGEENLAVVDAILHDVGQVESVIRDLLEVARPGDLRRRPVRLNDLVGDVLRQMSAQLAYRRITVRTALEDRLPLVLLDEGRFTQALSNVIVNAAEAMHTGGTLEIGTRAADDATILLEVCDTGVGVDPALLDRVFEPFVSTKPDGVGLGLVNAKAVVDSHAGSIAIEPRTPNGTRVSIRLPVTGAASSEATHG